MDNYPISKKIALDNGSEVVLFDLLSAPAETPHTDSENNIYLINSQGEVVWEISAPPPVYPGSPFTGIGRDKDKKFIAYRFDGTEYEVNLATGRATPLKLAK